VLVSLSQSEIPQDEKSKLEIFYGCSNGWTFWLANLKAYLEHGILLNETKIDLRGFDLAGYEFVINNLLMFLHFEISRWLIDRHLAPFHAMHAYAS